MLKSTLNSPKPSEPKRPTLPHMFKNKRDGSVVLFFEETSGTVVTTGKFNRHLHHHEFGWVPCWDTKHWTPLQLGESITITVESED